jgi:glucose/arabinose dehydrogenase
MRPALALTVASIACMIACDNSPTEPPPVVLDPATFHLGTQPVVSGLSSAVYVTAPPGDSRLFIVEQVGRIRIFKNGALLPTPFLDVSGKLTTGGERGLLSMAFDPQFATNGRFYIYYTGALGDIYVDRHTVSANPDVAGTTATPVITVQHRAASNHNGGLLMFGPDGMLYIGTGDGGGGGDPSDNAQNIDVLLGKLLRIDVTSLPYSNPASNPFVGRAGADEIWAFGLRNPWRYSFDGQRLFIADVGQNAYEEVNVVDAGLAGVNYGWRRREGMHCYNPSSGCESAALTDPVLEYGRGDGCSITGGFVYRGSAIPDLRGHYLYSDYCSGWLRSFVFDGTVSNKIDWETANVGNVTSFGVDGSGEIYIVTPGAVHRIVKTE